MIIADGCVVTFKDGTVNELGGDGSIVSSGKIAKAVNGGTINIESGNYTSTGDYCFWAGGRNETGHINISDGVITGQEGAAAAGKDSTLTVSGGTLTGNDNAVLASNGLEGYEGATINVEGGRFIGKIQTAGYTGCGIYFPNAGEVNVSGGEFDVDGVGICARAGKINVTGGTFKTNVTTEGWVGDKKTVISANALYYDGAANYPGLSLGTEENTYHFSGAEFTPVEGSELETVVVTQPTNGKTVEEV